MSHVLSRQAIPDSTPNLKLKLHCRLTVTPTCAGDASHRRRSPCGTQAHQIMVPQRKSNDTRQEKGFRRRDHYHMRYVWNSRNPEATTKREAEAAPALAAGVEMGGAGATTATKAGTQARRHSNKAATAGRHDGTIVMMP